MPRKRHTRVTDYLKVKHVYHPDTGQLLGVFAVDEIPADPKALARFARRKAKTAKAPSQEGVRETGSADGWDELRKQSWWQKVVDPGFWKERRAALEALPFGLYADLNGPHERDHINSRSDSEGQLWRDSLREQSLLVIDKLEAVGLKSGSDVVDVLLDLLKGNSKYGGRTELTEVGHDGKRHVEARYVNDIRRALAALYSVLATQALENEIRLKREQAERTKIGVTSPPVGDNTLAPRQSRRHGFEPAMDLHRPIVAVVERHAPNWRSSDQWRHAVTLKKICTDLDADEIEVPESWSRGKPQSLDGAPAKSWSDALGMAKPGKKLVADQIRTSIEAVRKQDRN